MTMVKRFSGQSFRARCRCTRPKDSFAPGCAAQPSGVGDSVISGTKGPMPIEDVGCFYPNNSTPRIDQGKVLKPVTVVLKILQAAGSGQRISALISGDVKVRCNPCSYGSLGALSISGYQEVPWIAQLARPPVQ